MQLLQIINQETAEKGFVLFDKLNIKFAVRLAADLLTVFILIRFIYYRLYKRSDLFLTFLVLTFCFKFIADDDDVRGNSNFIVRTRLELDYSLTKKMNVYASVDPYFTFETDEYPIDNIRNTLGLKYEYAKNKKVEVYYIYRPDFAKSYNRTFHVIGVNLSFKAKRK